MGRRMPFHSSRDVFEHVRKSKGPRIGLCDRPPDPVCLRLGGHAGMRLDQRGRVPLGLGSLGDEGTRNCFALADGDEKNARPRLRNEKGSVDDGCPEFVFRVRQRGGNGGKILSAVGRQTAVHVFKNDRSWSAVGFHEAAHQSPERPKGSRTRRGVVPFAPEAAIAAGERKVLAWKGSPCEVDACGGQIRQR